MMSKNHITKDDPLLLTLSSDLRFEIIRHKTNQPPYLWQIEWCRGEPPSLSIKTDFSLQARSFQLFPRFCENDNCVIDPKSFATEPVVTEIFTNYASLTFAPLPELDVEIEYWVPATTILAIRTTIKNKQSITRKIDLEWISLLNPLKKGKIMNSARINNTTILAGQTENISPVLLFHGGGTFNNDLYPSLKKSFSLSPNESVKAVCLLSACNNLEETFQNSEKIFSLNWDAEIAKIEIKNSKNIQIETGNPDWNIAFKLSQNLAYQLVNTNQPVSSSSSAIEQETIAQSEGNNAIYHLDDPLTVLDIYYLLLNPLALDCDSSSLVFKHLISRITNNKSPEQQKQPFLPVLASLALSIYKKCANIDLLASSLTPIVNNFLAWFNSENDRDQDNFPEWHSIQQLDFHEHPLFTLNKKYPFATDTTTVESPALIAFLLQELNDISKISEILGEPSQIPNTKSLKENLIKHLNDTWDDNNSIFRYRDRDSHFTNTAYVLSKTSGNQSVQLNKTLRMPSRIIITVQLSSSTINNKGKNPKFFIHGTNINKVHKVEKLVAKILNANIDYLSLTSEEIYSTVETIEIFGLNEKDKVGISTPNHRVEDITLSFPLWQSPLEKDKIQTFLKDFISNPNKFMTPYGLASISQDSIHLPVIHPIHNFILGSNLANSGEYKLAANIVTRLMKAIINNLKWEQCFRQYYDARTGKGIGKKNHISGTAPIGLFLMSLGIEIFSPKKVLLRHKNPYPWKVSIKYKGLKIIRGKKNTTITFPSGQTITTSNPKPQLIELP